MTSLEQWSALIAIGYTEEEASNMVRDGSALSYIRAWRILSRDVQYYAAVRAARKRLSRGA